MVMRYPNLSVLFSIMVASGLFMTVAACSGESPEPTPDAGASGDASATTPDARSGSEDSTVQTEANSESQSFRWPSQISSGMIGQDDSVSYMGSSTIQLSPTENRCGYFSSVNGLSVLPGRNYGVDMTTVVKLPTNGCQISLNIKIKQGTTVLFDESYNKFGVWDTSVRYFRALTDLPVVVDVAFGGEIHLVQMPRITLLPAAPNR
jgi:hypothetical protein